MPSGRVPRRPPGVLQGDRRRRRRRARLLPLVADRQLRVVDRLLPKFGLFRYDPETLKRAAQPSARIYRDISHKNGIPAEPPYSAMVADAMPKATVKTTPPESPPHCRRRRSARPLDRRRRASRGRRAPHAGRRGLDHMGECAERVPRIAAGLADLGIDRGDALALMLVNRPTSTWSTPPRCIWARRPSRSTTPPLQSRSSISSQRREPGDGHRAGFLQSCGPPRERSGGIDHIVVMDGDEDTQCRSSGLRKWTRRSPLRGRLARSRRGTSGP